MEHPGIVGRRLAIDRALFRLAVMDLQGLVGEALADMLGILADMTVQRGHHLAEGLFLLANQGDRSRRRGRRSGSCLLDTSRCV